MAKAATSLHALELHTGARLISMPIGALVDRAGASAPDHAGSVVAGSIYVALPFASSRLGLLACTAAISFFTPLRFVL